MPKVTIVESHKVPLSQIDLITAICRELDRQTKDAFKGCSMGTISRQMNAIINAVNSILSELSKPYRPSTPGIGFAAWMQSDDTGLSSVFMARFLYGHQPPEVHYPKDAADFGRCMRMLDACPELKPEKSRIAEASPEWSRLIQDWDRLTEIHGSDPAQCTLRIAALTSDALPTGK